MGATAAAGFVVYGWRPEIADAPSPGGTFTPELVAHGEVLAGAGYCGVCHTSDPEKPYAGGRGLVTQFGTIYPTNITPDPTTGIGSWSRSAFARAMREGVSRDGSHLFPAFPYDHFALLSDDDVDALYAYFMTRTPVRQANQANTLPFPLNIRCLQAGWKLLFFRPPEPENAISQTAEARGRYLVEGIAHCGACHTPRNALGAEIADRSMDGADIDGWTAPGLNGTTPSPAGWGASDFYDYLRTGSSRLHGTAAGPMSPVVHQGLAKLPDDDIQAISQYLVTLGDGRTAQQEAAETRSLEQDAAKSASPLATSGERLYVTACATCHFNAGEKVADARPELGLNSALFLEKPDNLLHAVLEGVSAEDGKPGVVMPAFRTMTDRDLAEIAKYLRSTRTDLPPWTNLEESVARIRSAGAAHE
ncbi:c-type cytochrome [Sinorhizobium mexicanum]|uniref:c-type cytochrome n=1 Tax=Sinorhizobium mexicanum TaxID=375549 RepID=UPI001DE352AB|nr:cytochrome c [Sinorhizobium mexicanum]MBP1881870.1 mono/diheme cytochrome c family protein [Sinorhizobium mexicanum]